MKPEIPNFANLSTPVKAGLVIASGGGILTAMVLIFPPRLCMVLFGGIAVVAVLLLAYWRLLKWLKKRKAAPMERGVIENTSATPQGIGEAAQVARLDDLRKKFEDGIKNFHAAGKSLYNFPWYMIVGEPGSGKTEAIRHCNVGFPPGLQDQFQGAGGTLNMNWWFTDHAVILDTAGRLMFEEVETGGSSEWKEFLKLMKKYRPRCPINGVFLVIPADSLITDTADEIERKASKIARQFDVIQRTLDVRFPVFVVVTKSDLIVGFREFFEGLDDPQLQHQIFGWSNPAPLDEPYDPESVGQHLKTIQERLYRRRLGLMQEIISEEPGIREKRAISMLYAFPQSLAKMAPRLAQYLELIFSVGSKWSCKPLFFRGIYFTSSMREGSALDEDLAESLGVPVESLPEGQVWERDRAYFLRDLFMKKVFREKGLVTHATNATKQHTRRKAAMLISAAASVVLLLLWTLYANRCFSTSVRVLSDILGTEVLNSEKLDEELQVIQKEGDDSYRYIGRSGIRGMPADVYRANFCTRLDSAINRWESEGGVPWIFWPVAWVARDITPDRLRKAEAVIYEISVLKPFLRATIDMMDSQQDGRWRCDYAETKALRQLLQIRANKPLNKEGEYSAATLLYPFFEYVFGRVADDEDKENSGKLKTFEEDKKQLHEPIAGTYGGAWPPAFLRADPSFGDAAILRGVELFNEYWTDTNRVGGNSQDWAQVETIRKLKGNLDRFDTAEEHILSLNVGDRSEPKSARPFADKQWEKSVGVWSENFAILREASENIQACDSAIKTPLLLEERWAKEANAVTHDVNKNYACLLNEINDADKVHFLGIIRDKLQKSHVEVVKKLRNTDIEERLKLLDKNFYHQVKDSRHLYQVRFDMYSHANEQIGSVRTVSRVEEVPGAVRGLEKAAGEARLHINESLNLDPAAFRIQKAADVSMYIVDTAEQMRVCDIVRGGLEAAPEKTDELENLIESQAGWDWACVPPEVIEKKFDPNAAASVFDGWKVLGDTLADTSKHVLPAELREKHNATGAFYTEYARRYTEYWLDKAPDRLVRSMTPHEKSWKAQRDRFEKLVVWDVLLELNKFGRCIEEALGKFENHIQAGDEILKQFRDSKEKFNDKLFQRKCDALIEKWATLSDDPFKARNTLLNNKPGLLVKGYFPFASDSTVEFADMYWTVLPEVSVSILANETKAYESEVLNKLRTQYGGKFPLARDGAIDLTYDEFKELYQSLSKAGLQGDLDPITVGSGADTELSSVDKQLKQLRPAVTSDKWFQAIKKLFRGLPEPPASYYCRIILPNVKEQKRLLRENETLLSDLFREFRIVQGTKSFPRLRTDSVDEKGTTVCMLQYPGPPIGIEFYSHPSVPDDQPSARLDFSQPWACLRMLCLAEPDKGKECIKLDVKDDQGSGGVLYLRHEFCREYDGKCDIDLPKLSEWPLSRQH
ncbi:MAG: hypothetical protein JXA81_03960 [Sedimentisphaerales bacterium]|nr:hypothetical protein [Sedimentisphaerales bacterium]